MRFSSTFEILSTLKVDLPLSSAEEAEINAVMLQRQAITDIHSAAGEHRTSLRGIMSSMRHESQGETAVGSMWLYPLHCHASTAFCIVLATKAMF